jgi:DNA-binding transcriptional regulator/RsmH inhibitor MraZ
VTEDREIRTCDFDPEDLVALAWDGLDAGRRAEVERHVMDCRACTAEIESVRNVREATRALGEIAPSPSFRERLMARVRDAAGGERTTPVKGLRIIGPATRRFAQIVARDRAAAAWFHPRWRFLAIAASAAACFAFLVLWTTWTPEVPEHPIVRKPKKDPLKIARRARVLRLKERTECRTKVSTRLEGRWLDVGDLLGDGEVILAGVVDASEYESCVYAFRASEWEAFSRRQRRVPEGPEFERFSAMARQRRVVRVLDGRIEIPEDLISAHIPGPDVEILRHSDRAEIWSRGNLHEHLTTPRHIPVDLGPVTLAGPSGPDGRRS